MHRASAVSELARALPGRAFITDEAGRRPYETDGLTAIRQLPWAVALPETEDQVLEVLRICREHEIPIVPRGAGTGLSGGARPLVDGVLLSLARLNQVVAVDVDNLVARVQPGVRNLHISQVVAQHGLFYAPDPSSQIACSIGGNVAENAGGVHCLKYGLTVHNVVALKVATIEGEVLHFGGHGHDAPGLDWLAILCGSEGMLGIVLEVTVQLTPLPTCKQVLMAGFPSLGAAGQAVAELIGSGLIPAGLEMMDALAVQAAEDFAQAGYPRDAAALLLCELDGTAEEVAAQAQAATSVFNASGATSIEVAVEPDAQARMWQGRKSAFPAVGRLAPDYYCMDGTIPRHRIGEVLERIDEMSATYGLRVANVFHAGDGNLHPLILYDANQPGELERAEQFGGAILELCVAVGGTVTGEHGVGVEKLDQMCSQFPFPPAELEQFFRLKSAFDPPELLNPGKAIPTLSRCSEVGGMHVHGGEVPFPHLDRF